MFSMIGAGCIAAPGLGRGADAKQPNLLFIMTDQQRFDALSYSGNKNIKTPNMDRIAREGVWFERMYSSCPVCVPARSVILTGKTIETVKIRGNDDVKDPNNGANVPTFDNLLAKAGYYTEYHGKWHIPYKYAATYDNKVFQTNVRTPGVPSEGDAYAEFVEKHNAATSLKPGQLMCKGSGAYTPVPLDYRYGMPPEQANRKKSKTDDPELNSQTSMYGCLSISPEYTLSAFVGKESLDALERAHKSGKPFAVTCSFGPPHPPMLVPEPYFSMFPAESLPVPSSISDSLDNSPYSRKGSDWLTRYTDPEMIRQMTQVYYGMIYEVDTWVGRILDYLEKNDMLDNTMIVFTSDHGEMLGDHGLNSKFKFYEGSVHVPLLIRFPGHIQAGTKVSTPVSHIDIFPTILDYLSLPPSPCDGRSLRPLIEGKGDDGMDFTISEWGSTKGPTEMIRDGRWKLIMAHNPSSEIVDALYDLENDPDEMNNLIGNNPDREKYMHQAKIMKDKLVKFLKKIDSPRTNGAESRTLK